MAAKTILDESSEYRITLHEGERQKDALIVTFAGQPGNLADQGFGTEFALRHGYDTVYVGQRYETHFQGLPLEAFKKAVEPLASERRVICYGPSLGAYAALYYGGTVNAEILAGAPMLPSWQEFDRPQYRELERKHISLLEVPKSSHAPFILSDPHEVLDARYLAGSIRPAFPGGNFVDLPYAGHTVLKTLHSANVLTSVVLEFFETGKVPFFELPTENFAPWHLNFGKAQLSAKNWREATRHGIAAFALEPSSGAASVVVRASDRLGDYGFLRKFLTELMTPEDRVSFVEKVPMLKLISQKAFEV